LPVGLCITHPIYKVANEKSHNVKVAASVGVTFPTNLYKQMALAKEKQALSVCMQGVELSVAIGFTGTTFATNRPTEPL